MKIATIKKIARYRRALLERVFLEGSSFESLTFEAARSKGVEAIIFDHDGILAPFGRLGPDRSGAEALREFLEKLGPGKVFILSNSSRLRAARSEYYSRAWPEVGYLLPSAKKPDPEGIIEASRLAAVPVGKIGVIDDGALTGILMALSVGAVPFYATRSELDESFSACMSRLFFTWPQLFIVAMSAPIKFIRLMARRVRSG